MAHSHFSEELSLNIAKIADLYQQIMQSIANKQASESNKVFDPLNMSGVIAEVTTRLMSDPEKLLKYQMSYTNNYLELINHSMSRFMGQHQEPLYNPPSKDYRFRDNAWNDNVMFDFIKQSYLMYANWLQTVIKDLDGIDDKNSKKINFCIKQIIDALAPTNFAVTNPEVLKEILVSNGENLVKGMEKFLNDIERSDKFIDISTTDSKAFEIGLNIATTKGKVIYQNDLMQLIQYSPIQPQIYQIPLLIIPPWINKFYILDLKENNSFVNWLLNQGYNVFIISWVNPSKEHAHKGFEDYMLEGPLSAIDAITKATGSKEVTAIGYCLGGTLLTSTLAYMKAHGDNRIKAATFLTTLVDFSDAGELSIFVDDEQLALVEKKMEEEGYFDGHDMATTFNMLRANDMIWSFFINNYLLGKDPLPFDLLYWNSDSTRLPASMHSFYLRNMYQKNLLAQPNGIILNNTPINVSLIDIPCYFLSTKEDHIAPWFATYKALPLFQGPKTFVLSASGHVAGVVNHPASNKYCYWVNENLDLSSQEWLAQSSQNPGSWWVHWNKWNIKHSGALKDALKAYNSNVKTIEPAPGSYVKIK